LLGPSKAAVKNSKYYLQLLYAWWVIEKMGHTHSGGTQQKNKGPTVGNPASAGGLD